MPSKPTDTTPADDAPRVPVLAWWNNGTLYALTGNVGASRCYVKNDGRGWVWAALGQTDAVHFATPRDAQLAVEAHLRRSLAPLAPLFATGGTDAE